MYKAGLLKESQTATDWQSNAKKPSKLSIKIVAFLSWSLWETNKLGQFAETRPIAQKADSFKIWLDSNYGINKNSS